MYKEFHFERSRHGDLHDHKCLKSKQEVFVLFRFGYVYNDRRSYCFFRVNLHCVGFQCCSFTKGRQKDALPFYNTSFNFLGFLTSILLFCL